MPIFLISFLLCMNFLTFSAHATSGDKIIDVFTSNGASVDYQKTKLDGSHQIILSAPKRINNELVIEKDRRIEGELHLALLNLSPALSLSESYRFVELYFAENGKVQFQCQQRACGVSSYWANNIFDERRLTGRDSDQYYISGTLKLPDAEYIVSVYMVSNALRQNLSYITYIKHSSDSKEWANGYLLPKNFQLQEDVRLSLMKHLDGNPQLDLYLAAYVDGSKFNTVSKMEKAINMPFLEVQKKLAGALSVNISKIRLQFVGAFHSQVPVEDEYVWFRLFSYQP